MKRRQFSMAAATSLAPTLAITVPGAWAQTPATPPREGKDFLRLKTPAPTESPAGKVEVLEFFWYNCNHCHAFEPAFASWKQQAPGFIAVRRVPIAFNASFVPQQKLYYALQTLDNFEALHPKVFHAIHVERVRLTKDEEILEWIGKEGVDVDKFKETYNSFSVSNQVRKATQLQQAYDVEGVPSMGIAGRYYTDGSHAGSMANVLRVVNYLAEQSRKPA